MDPRQYLNRAARIAFTRPEKIRRKARIAAIAIRFDGAQVCAVNEAAVNITPEAHAEARLVRKLDVGATIFVARVLRNGEWANATPCEGCRARLRSRHPKRVYYTISRNEWGVWLPDEE